MTSSDRLSTYNRGFLGSTSVRSTLDDHDQIILISLYIHLENFQSH